jgi:hypothetical protein
MMAISAKAPWCEQSMKDALRAIQKGATAVNLQRARACSGGRGGWRGWGRLGPRPRPAAQARPMYGKGLRESLCAVARLGLRSPCQRRAPRVLVRASTPCEWFALESCGADLGSVCCTAAGNDIGPDGATALMDAFQENRTVIQVNVARQGARVCSGGRGGWRGWGRLGPRPRPGAPNVRGEREPLRGRAPRAALALPAASGPARSRASAPCACFALES